MVERRPVKAMVVGSSPTTGADTKNTPCGYFLYMFWRVNGLESGRGGNQRVSVPEILKPKGFKELRRKVGAT